MSAYSFRFVAVMICAVLLAILPVGATAAAAEAIDTKLLAVIGGSPDRPWKMRDKIPSARSAAEDQIERLERHAATPREQIAQLDKERPADRSDAPEKARMGGDPPPPAPPTETGFAPPPRPDLAPVTAPAAGAICTIEQKNAWLEQLDALTVEADRRLVAASDHLKGLARLSSEMSAARAPIDHIATVTQEARDYHTVVNAMRDAADAIRVERAAALNRPLDPCPAERPVDPPVPSTGLRFQPETARKVLGAGGRLPAKECPKKRRAELRKPISVGSNGKVGSGARTTKKLLGTLGGLAGGLLGGGGGGGGGSGSGGPRVADCKIKDSEKTLFTDTATGTTLKVGAKRTGDTVVVFADIGKSADKGTFQGGWIETADGGVFGPHRADICELWGEWKLTVSWTRSTYVDGQLVSRESGGFSKGGLFSLPGIVSTDAAPSGMWQQLGFSNAQAGARGVAMQYRVPAAELAQAPMNIVIHVTRPSQKMVDTVPFDLVMTEGPDGIALTQAPPEEDAACPPDEGASAGMDEGAVASGPETPPTSLSGKTRVAGAESVGDRTPPPDPKPESGTPRRDPPLKDDGGSVFIGLPPPEGAQYHSVEREPKPRYFTVERAPPIRYHSVERDAADSGNVALVEIDATACTKGAATATPANSTVTIACTPTPGATKAELVVCGKPGTMVDRARLCVTEPVPGAVKSFAFPHVLEQTGGSSSNQFSFDTSFFITYAAGLQAPATGCGTQVDVFLFDPATDGTVTKPVSPSSAVKLLPICVDALSSGAQTGKGLLVPFGPDFGGAVSAGTVSRGLDTDRTARDIGVRFSW